MEPISVVVGFVAGFVVGGAMFYVYGKNVITRALDLASKVEAQVKDRLDQLKK